MQVTVRASNFGALGAGAGVIEREQQLQLQLRRLPASGTSSSSTRMATPWSTMVHHNPTFRGREPSLRADATGYFSSADLMGANESGRWVDYVLVNLPKRVMTGRSTPWRCAMTGCSSRLAGTNSYRLGTVRLDVDEAVRVFVEEVRSWPYHWWEMVTALGQSSWLPNSCQVATPSPSKSTFSTG